MLRFIVISILFSGMRMKQRYFKTRAQWRQWLADNHQQESAGLWLVYYRQETGKPTLTYGESVEEALSYGWIDSIIRKLDAQRFARKFTPRRPDSMWSETNRKRVERLIAQGRMQKAGLKLVEHAKTAGTWNNHPGVPDKLLTGIHPDFSACLVKNPIAKAHFEALAPSYRKQYTGWINMAKREETRNKRIKEAIRLLASGEKLGMK